MNQIHLMELASELIIKHGGDCDGIGHKLIYRQRKFMVIHRGQEKDRDNVVHDIPKSHMKGMSYKEWQAIAESMEFCASKK